MVFAPGTKRLQLTPPFLGAGCGPLASRESPTLASTGETRITPSPGGFMISSFFDVFTELSLDGGKTWSPASQPGHM